MNAALHMQMSRACALAGSLMIGHAAEIRSSLAQQLQQQPGAAPGDSQSFLSLSAHDDVEGDEEYTGVEVLHQEEEEAVEDEEWSGAGVGVERDPEVRGT